MESESVGVQGQRMREEHAAFLLQNNTLKWTSINQNKSKRITIFRRSNDIDKGTIPMLIEGNLHNKLGLILSHTAYVDLAATVHMASDRSIHFHPKVLVNTAN